jgi:hypothetical protein
MTVEGLDSKYGLLRKPGRTDPWEEGQEPLSKVVLDSQVAQSLANLRMLASEPLFRYMATKSTYIWAMAESGSIIIAVEELYELEGYPRRRGIDHPWEQKKLGHPTLLGSGEARIAGELLLDLAEDGSMLWILNANSGRYCEQHPPRRQQLANVANMLGAMGLEVTVDYDI